MKKEIISGVYKITNVKNNKFYIGRSSCLKNRKYRHFLHLKKGIHHNKHLQRSYNKYGEENFTFEVLEYTTDIVNKELYYFNMFNVSTNKLCYNIRDIPDKVQEDETRYRKKISMFTLDGQFITSFNSIKEASLLTKVSKSGINLVLKGKRKKSGNYFWQYGLTKEFIMLKNNPHKTKYKNIYRYDLEDNLIDVFEYFTDVQKFLNKKAYHVLDVVKGIRKTAYGYKWKINA